MASVIKYRSTPPNGSLRHRKVPGEEALDAHICFNRSGIDPREKPLCFPLLPGLGSSGSLQHIHQRLGKNSQLEKTLTLTKIDSPLLLAPPQPAYSRADNLTHILPAVSSSGNGVGQRLGSYAFPLREIIAEFMEIALKIAVMESKHAKHFKSKNLKWRRMESKRPQYI